MYTPRQAFAYLVVAFFVLFFLSHGATDYYVNVIKPSLAKNGRVPDFSVYNKLKTLSTEQFPLEDPKRQVVIVGDIHGMIKPFSTLLDKVSYNGTSDVLVHVGDIVTKGGLDGSMAVLSFMTSNNITGVRGNHDQQVIEWRGWINWIRSFPGGKGWLDNIHNKWLDAEAKGAVASVWIKEQKKKDGSKWWKTVPKGWVLFDNHYMVAYTMTEAHYNYLTALPLALYIPSAHTYIVHAGLLPSDPNRPFNYRKQPLAHIPSYRPAMEKGKKIPKNKIIPILRGLQEMSVLNEIPQNKDPWNILNMRSIVNGKVTKYSGSSEGRPWSTIWNHDISRCEGFDHDVHITKHREEGLPCHPASVIYGHAASRGLDIKRWSMGLDSGCVYKKRLTCLVFNSKSRYNGDDRRDRSAKSIPFGDNSSGLLASVSCP